MAIYAIGDIQGCYEDLTLLLEHIKFNPQTDKLWFVGDLVNRGPDSLSALRFVKEQVTNNTALTVLGNHDLHLLAIYHGIKKNKDPGITQILNAPDCDELIHWLRKQPLLIHDPQTQFTIVHAGIYPRWTLEQAKGYANELETVLRSDNYLDFLNHMYGDQPDNWSSDLTGWDRLRFICNSFSRMRYCQQDGQLNFDCNGAPGSQESDLIPWFNLAERSCINEKIIFGHWATLGYFQKQNGLSLPDGIYATDTGCVWGGQLTALKIDGTGNHQKIEVLSIDCLQRATP